MWHRLWDSVKNIHLFCLTGVFPSITHGNLDNKLSRWFLLTTYSSELSTDAYKEKKGPLFFEGGCKVVYSAEQVTCIECQTCEWDCGQHGEGGLVNERRLFLFDSPTRRALLSHSCRGRVQRPPLWCWPDPLPDWWTPGYLGSNNARKHTHTRTMCRNKSGKNTHRATNLVAQVNKFSYIKLEFALLDLHFKLLLVILGQAINLLGLYCFHHSTLEKSLFNVAKSHFFYWLQQKRQLVENFARWFIWCSRLMFLWALLKKKNNTHLIVVACDVYKCVHPVFGTSLLANNTHWEVAFIKLRCGYVV